MILQEAAQSKELCDVVTKTPTLPKELLKADPSGRFKTWTLFSLFIAHAQPCGTPGLPQDTAPTLGFLETIAEPLYYVNFRSVCGTAADD